MAKKIKLISKPGFYPDIPEPVYLSDPVETPTLSNTICKLMVNRSPRHAKYAHPRFNPAILEDIKTVNRPMDIGSAVHKRLLGAGNQIMEVPFDDYKKGDAKKMRDEAREANIIPILSPDMGRVDAMVTAAQEQLADEGLGNLFTKGRPELTMVWKDRLGVWCRGRLDYLHDEALTAPHIIVPEVKTTDGSAHPDDWQHTFFDMAYDYQAVMYERGLKLLLPHIKTVEFMWIVIEQKPPHGLSIVRMGGQAQSEAAMMVEVGIDMWNACTTTNKWPGYDSDNPPLEPAFWRSNLKEARRLALQQRMNFWQRPLQ